MKRECFYLCENSGPYCRCRCIFLFLPLGVHSWLLLGVENSIACIYSPAWPECCTVVLPAENMGTENREVKKCMALGAFLCGIMLENCNTAGQGPPCMDWCKFCGSGACTKNPEGHRAKVLIEIHVPSFGQREQAALLQHGDSCLYNQVGLEYYLRL